MQLHVTNLAYMATALAVLALGITLNAYDFQKCELCAPSPTIAEFIEEMEEQDHLHSYIPPVCGPYTVGSGFRSSFIHWTLDGSSLIFNEKESVFPIDGGIIRIADVDGSQRRAIVAQIPIMDSRCALLPEGTPVTDSARGFTRTCPQMARPLYTLHVSLLSKKN